MLILVLGVLGGIAFVAGLPMLKGYLVQEKPLENADAIVVMAGNREERLPAAARLYHDGVASTVLLANDGVFASWSREYQRNLYLVEWAREDLLDMGVPREDIVLLEFTECGSIHDALNTRDYVLPREGISSLLVVTSDYHARRTLWSFRHVFREEDIRIGIHPAGQEKNGSSQNLRTLALELFKYVYYRVRYGLPIQP